MSLRSSSRTVRFGNVDFDSKPPLYTQHYCLQFYAWWFVGHSWECRGDVVCVACVCWCRQRAGGGMAGRGVEYCACV
jgi:hypothetical protein